MTSKEKRRFPRLIWLFSAMIRVYENTTREISLLPRENKSFRQASQTVFDMQAHLAHPTQTPCQEPKTSWSSTGSSDTCRISDFSTSLSQRINLTKRFQQTTFKGHLFRS